MELVGFMSNVIILKTFHVVRQRHDDAALLYWNATCGPRHPKANLHAKGQIAGRIAIASKALGRWFDMASDTASPSTKYMYWWMAKI